MFTQYENSTRLAISAVAALAIVAFNAVALDRAHLASAPRGTVEIGELTLIDTTPTAAVTLPEVVVLARREAPAEAIFASTTQLPEIVVVAKRVAHMVARTGAASQAQSVTGQASN